MQNYLKKIGLPIPVQVVHEANAIDRLIHLARPTDLLVLGIPNDFVIQHSFGDSHAGQALRHSAGPVVAVSRGSGDDAVSLNSTLWEATVLCDLQAGSKWQAMEEMVEALVDAGQIPYSKRSLVLEDLFKRESELSTYVGNGVAVPHAALDDCVDPIVCLAVSRNGIPYDEEPANFIFMLISSRQYHVKYLKMQAGIARFMKRSALERREQMLDCNSAAEVVQVLRAELQPEERGIGYIF